VPAVTIDTNIFISAFEYTGKPRALVQMALDGEIDVVISQPIIDETLRVLKDIVRNFLFLWACFVADSVPT
jgi:predicted nucleic acid-binding protein